MRSADLGLFAFRAVSRHRLRSGLLLVAMAVGVAAVVLLTALGEGARRYVTGEFAALGTNLLIVLPGRNETTGGAPPLLGETPRDLTIDDALALGRHRSVARLAPLTVGMAAVSHGRRDREITILGTTHDFRAVRHLDLALGRFLPALDPRLASPVVVLGGGVRDELFGPKSALGQWLRIGDRRFRVVGVLASSGQSLGTDLDDVAIIPLASAQQLFNTASLFRILVEADSLASMGPVRDFILTTIQARHDGEDDVTILTQDAILATFDQILGALTLALGGIAGISLVVAGILIMNVTLVAVSQRTREIGLLKALGATAGTLRGVFLAEAALLSAAGAGVGLGVGLLGVAVGRRLFPDFPLTPPLWAVAAALGVAVGAGLLFAWLPARKAARLDPVRALSGR